MGDSGSPYDSEDGVAARYRLRGDIIGRPSAFLNNASGIAIAANRPSPAGSATDHLGESTDASEGLRQLARSSRQVTHCSLCGVAKKQTRVLNNPIWATSTNIWSLVRGLASDSPAHAVSLGSRSAKES